MNSLFLFFSKYNKILFVSLFLFCLLPFVSPGIALLTGLVFALVAGHPFPALSKKTSKYLLQFSVVGLGFGMNLQEALHTGTQGLFFTIISVILVMLSGIWLGRRMRIDKKTAYLISAGTAICGGSAIAAIAPVVKANDNEISVSMGTIFILNAIALFLFPPIGHILELSQEQFGMWAAIAIHDTSSVVGAGAEYGNTACEIATMVKLTRALWIIPLAIITTWVFKQKENKITFPWFILFFILAMAANTFLPIPETVTGALVWIAKKGLTVTLFLIGTALSPKIIKNVGFRPMAQAVILWIFIILISLPVIIFT